MDKELIRGRGRKVILALAIVGALVGLVLATVSVITFAVTCKEIIRRGNINSDIEVIGTVVDCIENSENNYSPVFQYQINENKYNIESEYIIFDSKEEALKCKDVTVKVNETTKEAYVEECRNIKGHFYTLNSVNNKALRIEIVATFIIFISFVAVNKWGIEK